MNTYCLGIDMSYTSPGICLYDGSKINFVFFYVPTPESRFRNFSYEDSKVNIKCYQHPGSIINNNDVNERVDKYKKVIDNILPLIVDNVTIKVGIEGYSYGSFGQGLTKLAEIGGILRYLLRSYKNIEIHEFQPTHIKMKFTGKGNSTKFQMWEQFKSLNIVDFYKVFNMKESKSMQPPHPIEDLVDAYAIVSVLKGEKIKPVDIVDKILDKF